MRKVLCVTTVCLLIMTFFSGCGVLQKLGFLNNSEAQPASSLVMNEEEAKKLSDKVPIHLYFANEDNSKLKLSVRYIPMEEAKKSVSSLASTIVKELLKGPGAAETGLKTTIPAGVSLRGPVAVNAGVATVDFTKEFVDKHPGGKEAAQMTIYSVVNTLTELKEVQKVKFNINGKAQSDFKGVFKFDTEFPRNVNLISNVPHIQKTETPAPAKDTAAPAKQPETKPDNKKQPAPTASPKAADTSKETSGVLNSEEDYLENLE